MFKRMSTIALATVAMMSLAVAALAAHIFSDVPDDHTHAEGIEWASEADVVEGYPDGTFKPDDDISRGQAASMFKRYDDLALERLNGLDDFVQDGEDGADGRNGRDGVDGEDGRDGVAGYEVVGQEVTIGSGGEQNVERTQNCPEGKVATGGGVKVSGEGDGDISIDASYPANLSKRSDGTWGATGWTVVVDNNSDHSGTEQVVAYAICANVN